MEKHQKLFRATEHDKTCLMLATSGERLLLTLYSCVIYGCHFFAISKTTLFKLKLDFSAHQVIKGLLVTIFRENLPSESKIQLHKGSKKLMKVQHTKSNFVMLIFVKRKALKICNSDVPKVNTKLFNFFIGQVHEK